jgi:nickel-dependent lactate racemase
MTTKMAASPIGLGGPTLDLSTDDMRSIIEEALEPMSAGARVLAIVPDKTRDDNTSTLFPLAASLLASKGVGTFDALVAQGTHPPMTSAEKETKVGSPAPGLGSIFDHRWDRAEELVQIGELEAGQVAELTNGLIDHAIPLRVNRLLERGVYDVVLVFGATSPHEVAGFSGGAKYFFPGVAGPELTHATHWLGALATIEKVIGRVETPIRRLIEAAADFIPARVISFTSVVTREPVSDKLHLVDPEPVTPLRTRALFAGDFRQALRRAAAVSKEVHIKYTGRKYKRAVALLDEHLTDLWVGGKASYRLGAVIEEGGELIIYAPHLRSISDTHGAMIERYGYAPLEIVRDLVAQSPELQANLCVAAHLAHVAYAGRRDEAGRIVPRFRITLASGIDQANCHRVNLGYLDPNTFRREDYETDHDTLVVENAGSDLYRVASDE